MDYEDEMEIELISWPTGRISKLVGSIPMRFKDDVVEARFRNQNAVTLKKTLVRVGQVSLLFQPIAAAFEIVLLSNRGMSSTGIEYCAVVGVPFALLAATPAFITIPEICVPAMFYLSEVVMLLGSKMRFASFFKGTDAQTAFGTPNFPQASDSLSAVNVALLILVYFVVMPVRSKLSLAMLPIVPSVYLALSLPVSGLEGGPVRLVTLAIRLLMLCVVGLMGRVYLETRERILFFRLIDTKKQLVKEKVLRCEAEHNAEHIAEKASARRIGDSDRDAPRSEAALSMATSNILSSVIFTPDEEIDARSQLIAIRAVAKTENWLLDEQRMEFYEDRIISAGGFGVVLRGRYHAGEVALKVPRQRTLNTSLDVTRALGRELRILRTLCHPSIVTFYGACIDPAKQVIVMVEELICGKTMKQYIKDHQVTAANKCRFLVSVTSALEYLHSDIGFLHGDIKPSNVMIAEGSLSVKLIDFGLSMRLKPGRSAPGGSFKYMAPEVLLGTAATCSSDIFSFGRLSYFVATGLDPLAADVKKEELVQLAKRQELPILDWTGDGALVTCCEKLCSGCFVDPAKRLGARDALEIMESWQFEDLDRGTVMQAALKPSTCSL